MIAIVTNHQSLITAPSEVFEVEVNHGPSRLAGHFLRTLTKNRLRSLLTVLGVVIGIAAVTTMVSIGQGAGQTVASEFRTLGPNVIMVIPGRGQQGRRSARAR